MKKINKYKLYNKYLNLSRYPNRIINFKRPKWMKLKTSIQSTLNRNFSIYDLLGVKVNDSIWDKINKHYKKKLLTNSVFKLQFKSKINSTKNIYNTRNLLLNKYFKNYYQPGTLLFALDYYSTKLESEQKIHFGNVNLIDSKVMVNANLSKGDILNINDLSINLSKNAQKYNSESPLLTYLEIDDYSQNVVLIKDLNELTSEDFYLINPEYINVNHLI